MARRENRAGGQRCDIFVGYAPQAPGSVRKFYKNLREACMSSGKKVNKFNFKGPVEENMQKGMDELNLARLAVHYLEYPLTDLAYNEGKFIGQTKLMRQSVIFVYEAEHEQDLRTKDPKIWWELKTPDRVEREFSSGGPHVITPTSTVSTMVPDSTYSEIVAEVKLQSKGDLSELEAEVKRFFQGQ